MTELSRRIVAVPKTVNPTKPLNRKNREPHK